jgi:plastocyanin
MRAGRHTSRHGTWARLRGLSAAGLVAAACTTQSDSSPATQPSDNIVVGTAPPAVRGLPSVITLEPEPAISPPVPAEPAVMDQFGIAFAPRLLVVRTGQPVEFRNSEDVAHNVRVRDAERDSTLFHEGTVMGDPFEYTFRRTGGYDVSCDIHPGMKAFILVVSAPYAVLADDDGSFAFADIPPGSYTLSVWNIDPQLRSRRPVRIRSGRTELTRDSTARN